MVLFTKRSKGDETNNLRCGAGRDIRESGVTTKTSYDEYQRKDLSWAIDRRKSEPQGAALLDVLDRLDSCGQCGEPTYALSGEDGCTQYHLSDGSLANNHINDRNCGREYASEWRYISDVLMRLPWCGVCVEPIYFHYMGGPIHFSDPRKWCDFN